jgi:putative peptide zinc metalloprotease protein
VDSTYGPGPDQLWTRSPRAPGRLAHLLDRRDSMRARFVLVRALVQRASNPSQAISATRFDSSNAKPTFVVRSSQGRYVQVTATAARLLELRDRGLSASAIADELASTPGVTAEAVEEGLARIDAKLASVDDKPLSTGFLFELPLIPARAVRWLTRPFVPVFHTWPAIVLVVASVVALTALFAIHGMPAVTMDAVFPAFGISLVTLFVHELGHAAACMRFGAAPSRIGFTIYVVYPAFFCDVTEAWTLSRRQRVVVDVGGFYLQGLAIAGLAVAYFATGWAPLHLAVWMALGTFALSLNPMFKFDGYWIVADALGVANLADERGKILRYYGALIRGRRPPPLPYPRWVSALLAPYSIVSFAFFGWFLLTATPALATHLIGYPAVVADMVGTIARGETPGGMAIVRLLAASFVTVLALLFFRMLARWVLAVVRSALRLLRRRTLPSPGES